MIALLCVGCQSDRLVKDGFTKRGQQRYRCRSCGRRSSQNPISRGVSAEKQALVLSALAERMSLRAAARAFGMSRDTITALLEKKTS